MSDSYNLQGLSCTVTYFKTRETNICKNQKTKFYSAFMKHRRSFVHIVGYR